MSSRSFSKAMTIKLIKLVKKYPCLYDNIAKKNSKSTDIDNAWKNIAEDCGVDIDIVKKKWLYQFSKYKTSLINPKIKSTFSKELSFLKVYLQEISAEDIQETACVIKKEPSDNNNQENRSDRSSNKRSRRISRFMSDENLPSTSLSRHSEGSQYHYSTSFIREDSEDEMTPYFQSVCCSTKKLPRDLQIQIKSKISEIINAAERTAMERDL